MYVFIYKNTSNFGLTYSNPNPRVLGKFGRLACVRRSVFVRLVPELVLINYPFMY